MAKIDKTFGTKLTLEEIWISRAKDPSMPKFITLRIEESQRRRFEREMGRPISWSEIEKIITALLEGRLKVR